LFYLKIIVIFVTVNNILTRKHFDTILKFSRKVTKGNKADDLSQHVILKVLQFDEQKLKGLIQRGELEIYLWQVVKRMYFNDHSTFNREEYGTHHFNKRLKTVDLDSLEYSLQSEEVERITIEEVIDKTNLTELEQLTLRYYLEYNGNYTTMADRLDIDRVTVTIKVKEIIEKCKKLK